MTDSIKELKDMQSYFSMLTQYTPALSEVIGKLMCNEINDKDNLVKFSHVA